MSTVILSSKQIKGVLNMKHVIDIVEKVLQDHGNGKVIMPPKINLNLGERGEWPAYWGSCNSMPAYVHSLNAMGIKFATGFKKNPEKGLPFILATIILCNPQTGYPLAVMDGTYITAMRTGAATGVAAKYLAKKDTKTLGVIGAGLQGRMNIMAIKEVFDIEKVKVMDIRKEIAQKCAEEMSKELDLEVQAVKTNMEVVEGSDIVITVTIADKPLVKKEWLEEGALVVSVGSYQELDALIPITTDKLVVDSWVQNTHRGELVKLIKSGKINKKDIYAELGEIVAGKKVGREKNGEMICTCLIGMASLDMGIARFVYNKLKSRDDTIKFELI